MMHGKAAVYTNKEKPVPMDHNPLARHWFIGYTDLSSTALLPVPKSSSHWYLLAAVAVPSKTVGASPQVRRQQSKSEAGFFS